MSHIDLRWQLDALCAQMPVDFHPDNGPDARLAKKVCRLCEVRAECLEFALANDEDYGTWGGLTETEFRALKARNRKVKVAAAVEEMIEPEREAVA